MADDPGPSPPGTWTRRRRRIDATLIGCAAGVVWMVERHGDNAMAVQVVMALITLAGSMLGAYIGGAVIDDKHARQAQRHDQ